MSELDVVAAIDAAADTLTECDRLPFLHALLRRARDEIVALRALVEQPVQHTTAWAAEIHAQARAKTLEEAAQEAAALGDKTCAHAIRALKDKQ